MLHLDVTSESQWQNVISKTVKQFGHLDILVNAAGIAPVAQSIEEVDLKLWQKVMYINLTGQFLGIKHFFPAMKENGGSIIDIIDIDVASINGLVGIAFYATYTASKGANYYKTNEMKHLKNGLITMVSKELIPKLLNELNIHSESMI